MPLTLCRNAVNDLREMRPQDPAATAAILAVLQQLNADPELIDKLTTRGEIRSGDRVFNNRRWQAMRTRADLWRLRILDSPATRYRVFHAYHWRTRRIWVLAVIHRSAMDYDDPDSVHARRMLDDWRRINSSDA